MVDIPFDFAKYPLPDDYYWFAPLNLAFEPGVKQRKDEGSWWYGWVEPTSYEGTALRSNQKSPLPPWIVKTNKFDEPSKIRGTFATADEAMRHLSALFLLGLQDGD